MKIFLRILAVVIVIVPMFFHESKTLVVTDIIGVGVYVFSFLLPDKEEKAEYFETGLENLDKQKYVVLSDYKFKYNEKIIKFSHIVVSLYGIFTIDYKDYKGNISGSDTSPNWVQLRNDYRNYFYNPVLDMQAKIECLKEMLGEYEGVKFYKVIAFNPKGKLNINSSAVTANYEKVAEEIQKFSQEVISSKEMNDIVTKLIFNSSAEKEILTEEKAEAIN